MHQLARLLAPWRGRTPHFHLARRIPILRISSTATDATPHPSRKVRNLGIIAHVDAGKTTVSERMLFYSGKTSFLGEVHTGSTVMDYMDMERERGITIASAAITFPWKDYTINLIDTPGHVDFSAEVERAVMVLDGSVVVLDSVAGVQAQTASVVQQAKRHRVPLIAFCNKMDREGADFENTVRTIENTLHLNPLVLQLPLAGGTGVFGHVDVLSQKLICFSGENGEDVVECSLDNVGESMPHIGKLVNDAFRDKVASYRSNLISKLVDLDDEFTQAWWQAEEEGKEIAVDKIMESIRRCTIDMKGLPVLSGSALKNVGVQTLLDAVGAYLPSPLDRPPVMAYKVKRNRSTTLSSQRKSTETNYQSNELEGEPQPLPFSRDADAPLCALAFKVKVDKHKGPIVWLRVYSGVLKKSSDVLNTNRNVKERVSQLYKIEADSLEPTDKLEAGELGAAVGLTSTSTGHTIMQMVGKGKESKKQSLVEICQPVFSPPVFLQTVEPESPSDQRSLEESLSVLALEDPSFHVKTDPETEQIVICGLGELHLQIIASRLQELHKKELRFGKVQISYKAAVEAGSIGRVEVDEDVEIGARRENVKLVIEVSSIPVEDEDDATNSKHGVQKEYFAVSASSNVVEMECAEDKSGQLKKEREQLLDAVEEAIHTSLQAGYRMSGIAYTNVKVRVTQVQSSSIEPIVVQRGVWLAMERAFQQIQSVLLEPVMKVDISVHEEYASDVVAELNRGRRANVLDFKRMMDARIVLALVPLKEMLGFSAVLRSLTKGNCSFGMEFAGYERMREEDESEVLAEYLGEGDESE